jgi:hypothetical protein
MSRVNAVCPVCDHPLDEPPLDERRLRFIRDLSLRDPVGYTDAAGGDPNRRQRLYRLWRSAWEDAGRPQNWHPDDDVVRAIVQASAE